MKQKIKSNTIMFVMIMLFVMLFKEIFGEANKMVGIVILIIGLVISEKDTTQNLRLLTLGLIIVNVLMGVASYMAMVNPFWGLVVNIPFIFYVTYFTVQGNKKPYHFPFILGYLFLMLSSPATLEQLPERVIALLAGSLMIVGLQYLFNKDTYKKVLKSQTTQLLNFLENRIDRILSHDSSLHQEEVDALADGMKRFMKITYERRNFKTPLSPESMERVTEMIALEKMYHLLADVADEYEAGLLQEKMLLDLHQMIMDLKVGDSVSAYTIINSWNDEILTPGALKLKGAFNMLKLSETKGYPVFQSGLIKQMIKEIDKESLAFKFSIRLTILLSMGLFITSFFNLQYGRWLCFTILALVQPGYEESNKKTLMRFIGTLIGAVAFVILFSVFKTPTSHTIIILLASYIGMYIQRYDRKMIVTTIQALGAAIIGTTGAVVAWSRIYFVMIGTIIAYLGNKYLFSIREKQAKEHYDELYEKYKNHLLQDLEHYPHSIIVEAYHVLEMGGEDSKYQEWLDISFETLNKSI